MVDKISIHKEATDLESVLSSLDFKPSPTMMSLRPVSALMNDDLPEPVTPMNAMMTSFVVVGADELDMVDSAAEAWKVDMLGRLLDFDFRRDLSEVSKEL